MPDSNWNSRLRPTKISELRPTQISLTFYTFQKPGFTRQAFHFITPQKRDQTGETELRWLLWWQVMPCQIQIKSINACLKLDFDQKHLCSDTQKRLVSNSTKYHTEITSINRTYYHQLIVQVHVYRCSSHIGVWSFGWSVHVNWCSSHIGVWNSSWLSASSLYESKFPMIHLWTLVLFARLQ